MNAKPVVVIGDANVDLVIQLPAHGQTAKHHQAQLFGGGSAANTAVGLARLGLPVHFCGAIGQDAYGDWVRQDLQAEGIDLSAMCALPGEFTTIVLAVIAADGDRSLNHFPPDGGAHNRLKVGDLPQDVLGQCAWLHTTGISMRRSPEGDTVLQAMRLARAAGGRVSIDLNLRIEAFGSDPATLSKFWEAVRLADVVLGSGQEEMMPLTGAVDEAEAARQLCEGRRIVVARQGPHGALLVTPTQEVHVPAFPVPVVDTLGAGDAFNGGFIYAHLAGKALPDCVRWGNAAAALKITRQGARGLPSLAEIETMIG
jgi:sugar/nucleoside kinase (ribokinase family)